MARINAGGDEFTYERIGKNRSEDVFEAELVVESRNGEVSIRRLELDVSSRDDLNAERLESTLEEWQRDHPMLTVERVVVREIQRCGFGERVDPDEEESTEAEAPLYRGGAQARARNPYEVGFGDVSVDQGDEVDFHVAGPSTSVYGTDTGTVTGVKTGTDDYDVLIVETDSGTKRVREDWLVDEDGDDETSADEAGDASE